MEELTINRRKRGRVVEIYPRDFGRIWSITFPSVTSAKRHEGVLRKFPQEKLWEMYAEAMQTIATYKK